MWWRRQGDSERSVWTTLHLALRRVLWNRLFFSETVLIRLPRRRPGLYLHGRNLGAVDIDWCQAYRQAG